MWKRWNYNNASQGPLIGQPTLIDTSMDEGYLETIPEVDSLKSKRSSTSTTMQDLPFRMIPSMQRAQQQHKEPAWSQPSPTIPDYYVPQDPDPDPDPWADRRPDISPQNSLNRAYTSRSIDETPVSPIEPELPIRIRPPLPASKFQSRIPQRVVSKEKQQTEFVSEQNQETRWDAYSGEPTNDRTGIPSTVRPGVQPLERQYPNLKERTKQILAGIREREAATRDPPEEKQVPTAQQSDPLDKVNQKEPWKGASGRTALVDPVQNNPSARTGPLTRTQRKPVPNDQPETGADTGSPVHALRSIASEESIKPVAPLKIHTKSRNPSPQSSTNSSSPPLFDAINSAPPIYQHPKSLQSPFSSPGPVRILMESSPFPTAPMESPLPDTAPETPRTPTPPAGFETDTPIKMQQSLGEPEVSRFSWTTYATSVTGSPGSMARIVREESPPPPMPQMPQIHIRKRPVSSQYGDDLDLNSDPRPSQGSAVIRKPVGSKPRASTFTLSSRLSLSKTLPQVPPELEATDKVSNLEAQLEALAMRKHNTTRIIRDLNASLKKNAVVYDMWKRKEIAERIAIQEAELQAITSEEHEISLRLHRVQKKRDKEDNYELPTGLWIKRVTT